MCKCPTTIPTTKPASDAGNNNHINEINSMYGPGEHDIPGHYEYMLYAFCLL